MNNINLMGRLTHTPEIKTTPSGLSVCSFSIAVDRRYTKPGEERKTDFIDCVAWRQTADFLYKYFSKGQLLALDGRLTIDSYENKQGEKRKKAFVTVDNIYFAEKSNKAENKSSQLSLENVSTNLPNEKLEFTEINTDDDLPF